LALEAPRFDKDQTKERGDKVGIKAMLGGLNPQILKPLLFIVGVVDGLAQVPFFQLDLKDLGKPIRQQLEHVLRLRFG